VVYFARRADEPEPSFGDQSGEWQPRHFTELDALAGTERELRQPPLPAAAVIDGGMPHAVPLARRIQRAAPLAQLIFVCQQRDEERLRRALRTSPLIGAHWIILHRDQPHFLDHLREQIRVGDRRRRHRSAISKVNAQLSAHARPAVDPQTLRRLVLSERHLATIVQHSPDPILTVAPNGEVASWNMSAEHLWGWQASHAVGRKLGEFLREECREEFERCLTLGTRTRDYVRREFTAARLDGGFTPVEMTIAPVLGDDGQILAFSIIARDNTARREAERLEYEHRAELEHMVAERTAQLQEMVTQLEQFSYTISHDLRAPLRAIQGYAEILRDGPPATAGADSRRYVDRIIRAGERMDRLIRDVLSYSRVATAKLDRQPVEVGSLVAEVIAQLPEDVRRKSMIVVEQPLPTVTTHAALLAQALGNLINNAVKFVATAENPQVRIWSTIHLEKARIFVSDRGIGIPASFHPNVFGIFERGVPGEQYQGTGIGLAIVKKSIERLGGRVGFESAEGNGSTFWIELPLHAS
jgi:PAS domain S-box-containing protein